MPLANSPAFGAMTPNLLSTHSMAVLGDVTTTSTTYVDLLSTTLAISGGLYLVTFSASGSNATNNTNVRFQLVIDGVVQRGTKFRKDGGTGGTAALCRRVALAAGTRTFKIQWSVSAGTGRIRASTVTEEHAWMLIDELSR